MVRIVVRDITVLWERSYESMEEGGRGRKRVFTSMHEAIYCKKVSLARSFD